MLSCVIFVVRKHKLQEARPCHRYAFGFASSVGADWSVLLMLPVSPVVSEGYINGRRHKGIAWVSLLV